MAAMTDNPHLVNYAVYPGEYTPDTFPIDDSSLRLACRMLVMQCHGLSMAAGWYHDPATGAALEKNVGESLMLIVSEVAEAMEGDRKGEFDKHLPHRLAVEVELADALIRIADFAGYHGLDVGGALVEKLLYNTIRPDHRPAARAGAGGKRY